MNEENNKEVFQCICGKQFDNKKSLGCHKSKCMIYQESVKEEKLKQIQEKESRRLPNGMFKCECCGKEHDGSYGSGRFCCKNCLKIWHLNDIHNSNRADYGRWKCDICGKICDTRHLLKQHQLLEHNYTKSSLVKIKDNVYQYECKYCHKKFKTAKLGGGHMINCPNHPNKDKYVLSHKRTGKTLSKKIHSGELIPFWKGRKHSSESCKKMRIKAIKRIFNLKGKFNCNYNKKSIQFFDNLSKEKGWNLQHAENGGEITVLGYWLDAYDKERNIVVEYDEPRHYIDIENNVLCEKDLKRQQEIINHLHGEFWRYNEKMKCLWKVKI